MTLTGQLEDCLIAYINDLVSLLAAQREFTVDDTCINSTLGKTVAAVLIQFTPRADSEPSPGIFFSSTCFSDQDRHVRRSDRVSPLMGDQLQIAISAGGLTLRCTIDNPPVLHGVRPYSRVKPDTIVSLGPRDPGYLIG